jgi:hypothetical protein
MTSPAAAAAEDRPRRKLYAQQAPGDLRHRRIDRTMPAAMAINIQNHSIRSEGRAPTTASATAWRRWWS